MFRQWHIHTLLNCVLREVSLKSRELEAGFGEPHAWLKISFKHLDFNFLFKVRNSESLTGNIEYLGESFFRPSRSESSSQDWERLGPEVFAEMIYKELSQTYSQLREPDFIQNFKNSLKVAEFLKTEHFSLLDEREVFLKSEQSLVYGHPFHPSPKSRLGFTDQDIQDYSPELGRGFRLRYFGVRSDLVIEDSIQERPAHQLLPRVENSQEGFIPIPLHPWEARYLAGDQRVQEALLRGDLIDLGEQGPDFFPTASVRTLFSSQYEYFLKMSLHVRITNCIRRNTLSELRSALEISKILKRVPESFFKQHRLSCLQEPAYLTCKLGGENETEGFGMLFRKKPGGLSQCLVAGALFGNHLRGRKWAFDCLEKSGLDLLSWWGRYLDALVVPSVKLFLEFGLMSEPHLQNVLVRLDHGIPEEVYIRDLDNFRVVDGTWAKDLLDQGALSQGFVSDLVFGEKEAFERFFYCLIVNHLNEAIFTFADGAIEVEREMWRILRKKIERMDDELRESLGRVRSSEALRVLMGTDGLPAKANLITRFRRCEDRKAMYFYIPNPIQSK